MRPSFYLVDIVSFIHTPLYKNKEFLHQKYIVEGLTCKEIASLTFSVRSTVLKYLKHFEIEVRPVGSNQNRKRGLAYGSKSQAKRIVDHKAEKEMIKRVQSLRDQGYSYQKIADILNTMKVPTKTRKGNWSRKQVWSILNEIRGD